MKLINLYESILNENGVQACINKFGDILFADQLGGNEKNTDVEDGHLKAVNSFTDFDFGENIKPEVLQAISNLKDCMSTFPEVLKPNNDNVFRGTNAPIIDFIKNGKIPTARVSVPYLYKARTKLQSWSEDDTTAKLFGSGAVRLNQITDMYDFSEASLDEIIEEIKDIRVPVILIHKATPSDFLFKGKYLNKISEFETEDEVIRFDDSPIQVEALLNDKWLSLTSIRLIDNINRWL